MSRITQGWLANFEPPAWLLKFGMNCWPPFRGARIRVEALSGDFRHARIAMPLKLANRNMWGVHFGGSLFAMTDGLYSIMLKRNLGRDYAVWDKSATIDFVKPGRGRVHATFLIDDALLQTVRAATRDGSKYLPTLHVQILDEQGEVVADVEKVLYVRKLLPKSLRRPTVETEVGVVAEAGVEIGVEPARRNAPGSASREPGRANEAPPS